MTKMWYIFNKHRILVVIIYIKLNNCFFCDFKIILILDMKNGFVTIYTNIYPNLASCIWSKDDIF